MPHKPPIIEYELYASCMASVSGGRGLAIWDPTPQPRPVRIGDVGFLYLGGFRTLFNVIDPSLNEATTTDLPNGFVPLLDYVRRIKKVRKPGRLVSSEARVTTGGAGFSIDNIPGEALAAKMSFSFDKAVTQGAILLTKGETHCHDVLQRPLFERYLLDYYQTWYDFARERYPVQNIDDIRLVMGLDSTTEFTMLAFAQNQNGVTFDFELTSSNIASLSAGWGQWTYQHPLVFDNWGPQEVNDTAPAEQDQSHGPDQCIFVRTLRVFKRPWPFAPPSIRAEAEPEDPDPEGSENHHSELWTSTGTSANTASETVEVQSNVYQGQDPADRAAVDAFMNSQAQLAVISDMDSEKEGRIMREFVHDGILVAAFDHPSVSDPQLGDIPMSALPVAKSSPSQGPLGMPVDTHRPKAVGVGQTPTSESGEGAKLEDSWWNLLTDSPRPWLEDKPNTEDPLPGMSSRATTSIPRQTGFWDRKGSVPTEQTESWLRTKEIVQAITSEVLGTNAMNAAADVERKVLDIGPQVLQTAPLQSLSEAAAVLVNIWNCVQLVETDRLQYLRLTERCATILASIRQEFEELGTMEADSAPEISTPLTRLIGAYKKVLIVVEMQSRRPFLKRYLKREESRQDLMQCHRILSHVLQMFTLSIQVRVLKKLEQSDKRMTTLRQISPLYVPSTLRTEIGVPPLYTFSPSYPRNSRVTFMDRLSAAQVEAHSGLANTSPDTQFPGDHTDDLVVSSPHSEMVSSELPADIYSAASQVQSTLAVLMQRENEHDSIHDLEDLRRMLRRARDDDAAMAQLLRVRAGEAPEAVRALQRALGEEIARELEEREIQYVADEVDDVEADDIEDPVFANQSPDASQAHVPELRQLVLRQTSVSSVITNISARSEDTLDREFMESAKDAIVRASIASGDPIAALALPRWTITRYEVDIEAKIRQSTIGNIWRGSYRGYSVLVHVFPSATPKNLFIHAVQLRDKLHHPNVLGMVGANAAEPSPFIVSPGNQYGNLSYWLWSLHATEWQAALDDLEDGILPMVRDIAVGMSYLHKSGVFHGDLQCANILLNNRGHCVISDFGLADLKSEIHRLSKDGNSSSGPLHRQPPEARAGQSKVTAPGDVYAFAWVCADILTRGNPLVPKDEARDEDIGHLDDSLWRASSRPELPLLRRWSARLADIVNPCSDSDPARRPTFDGLSGDIGALLMQLERNGAGLEGEDVEVQRGWSDTGSEKADEQAILDGSWNSSISASLNATREIAMHANDSMLRTPARRISLNGELEYEYGFPTGATEVGQHLVLDSATTLPISSSPEPTDPRLIDSRDERRYRMLLQHEFHPSLVLPLWSPSPVAVGAIGYLKKPEGSFVTLSNAFSPPGAKDGHSNGLPSLGGYGRTPVSTEKIEKRSSGRRALGHLQGIVSRQTVSRTHSLPLHKGQKTAHLFVDSAVYRYMVELSAARKWFQANVDQILAMFGTEHAIQREDIMLVTGVLDAADYALFVNHGGLAGKVDFEVFAKTAPGDPWGQLITTAVASSPNTSRSGEVAHFNTPRLDCGRKISAARRPGEPPCAVLLARLRFAPDRDEPTSL
ncbi:hypothetical protein PsYK624_050410 [Phanerochaete sordida]|uniref:Protein kinase domain-containing protein n=1 Tax=Phanerochaete sordida TaxID=48140 RepID=A0A9P3G4E8_9APHY|nr:hypothetical protein PsYK624_050410 [Phanerochaete sordida]